MEFQQSEQRTHILIRWSKKVYEKKSLLKIIPTTSRFIIYDIWNAPQSQFRGWVHFWSCATTWIWERKQHINKYRFPDIMLHWKRKGLPRLCHWQSSILLEKFMKLFSNCYIRSLYCTKTALSKINGVSARISLIDFRRSLPSMQSRYVITTKMNSLEKKKWSSLQSHYVRSL